MAGISYLDHLEDEIRRVVERLEHEQLDNAEKERCITMIDRYETRLHLMTGHY